jgi:excisionase family DNA binding protein
VTEVLEEFDNQTEWLSLGKAAALLGVHNMTLRRWSDSGRFPSYRTAGGHRRFAMKDIQEFLAQEQPTQDEEEQPLSPDNWAESALVLTRAQVADRQQPGWMQAIDDQKLRDEYRQLGHRLMGLLLQYIATDEPNGGFIEEARRIGRMYAMYGMNAGLSLTDILEATLFFRDILVESSLQVPETTKVEPESSLRILRRVNQIINAVQLTVTGFYENMAKM